MEIHVIQFDRGGAVRLSDHHLWRFHVPVTSRLRSFVPFQTVPVVRIEHMALHSTILLAPIAAYGFIAEAVAIRSTASASEAALCNAVQSSGGLPRASIFLKTL